MDLYTSKDNDYLLDEFDRKDWHIFRESNSPY